MSKLSKHELRDPDQVWKAGSKTMRWMQQRWTALVVFVVVVLGGVMSALYIHQVNLRQEGEAQFHFSRAKAYFEQWSLQESKEKEETLSKLEAELGILGGEYRSSNANVLAHLVRAKLASAQKDWQASTKHYEAYVKGLPSGDQVMGLYPLAVAYEKQGDYEGALKTYERVLENKKDDSFHEWALLGMGRSLRKLNRPDEAKAVYERYLQEYPSSTSARRVRGILALGFN